MPMPGVPAGEGPRPRCNASRQSGSDPAAMLVAWPSLSCSASFQPSSPLPCCRATQLGGKYVSLRKEARAMAEMKATLDFTPQGEGHRLLRTMLAWRGGEGKRFRVAVCGGALRGVVWGATHIWVLRGRVRAGRTPHIAGAPPLSLPPKPSQAHPPSRHFRRMQGSTRSRHRGALSDANGCGRAEPPKPSGTPPSALPCRPRGCRRSRSTDSPRPASSGVRAPSPVLWTPASPGRRWAGARAWAQRKPDGSCGSDCDEQQATLHSAFPRFRFLGVAPCTPPPSLLNLLDASHTQPTAPWVDPPSFALHSRRTTPHVELSPTLLSP